MSSYVVSVLLTRTDFMPDIVDISFTRVLFEKSAPIEGHFNLMFHKTL